MLPRETLARLFVLEPIAGLRSRRIRSRVCLHTDDIIPPFALSVSLQRWSGYLCNDRYLAVERHVWTNVAHIIVVPRIHLVEVLPLLSNYCRSHMAGARNRHIL